MKPHKVLHILDVDKEAFYFNNLCDFTPRSEVEFSFITLAPAGEFTKSIEKRGLRVYGLDARSKRQLLSTVTKIWKILKIEKPDIVHAHLFYPSVLGLALARLRKIKTVLTRHHSDALHLLPNKIKRSFYLTIENFHNHSADHIVAPSRMVKKCLVEWENVPEEKVSLIPYGQTSERFEAVTEDIIRRKRIELGMSGHISLVCVSRLFDRKGHKYLFDAVAPLIKNGLNAKLYLVGEGEYRKKLEYIASNLGILQNIEFLGWREDALAIMAAADIVVHPSLEDALSQSLIESLMLQRPIIATDISGAADTLDGGKYGQLVPPADSNSFRIALKEVIENLDAAQEKAKLGREYLLEYMDAKHVAAKYLNIYKKVLAN